MARFYRSASAGNPAHARGSEVGGALVNCCDRAEKLVARFLPFCHQIPVDDLLANAKVDKLTRDLFLCVMELIHVARALVIDTVDWPLALVLALALVRLVDRVLHTVLEHLQRVENNVPALGSLLRKPLQLRHPPLSFVSRPLLRKALGPAARCHEPRNLSRTNAIPPVGTNNGKEMSGKQKGAEAALRAQLIEAQV